ncbi:hypothetical protein [Aestuariivirga sp.]|uniref:calcium-binding protein n=1 Tax=Aestuariivirga sp. TaxID=2650926 RepID=UPI0039E482C7
MANVTVSNFAPDWLYWGHIQGSDFGDPSLITTRTATAFRFTMTTSGDFANWTFNVTGTGFTYLTNGSVLEPTAGNITSIIIKDAAGHAVLTINGFAAGDRPDLTELYFNLFNTSSSATPDLSSMFTWLLHGNDTINGSANSDDLVAGRNPGNDTINGNGGDDYIKGDAGNDTLNGGADFDTLSYTESFYDPYAYKGINLDVAAGTVQDCWGGTDTISGFEAYEGSRFADVMTGSDAARERFYGLRGADTINGGGGGKEIAAYDRDAEYGGIRGIIANLPAGTIRDGFGQTDHVSNIQRVIGTMYNDKFTGDAANNQFMGLDGVDSFNGGGGNDVLNFSANDGHGGLNGVNVNLNKASAQIIDDGYGNTETATNFESVQGTMFADTIRLSGVGGYVWAGLGADTLSGGAGVDTFEWDLINEFGDTVTNFKSGTDILDFEGLEGQDGVVRFENNNHSTLGGPAFYFNAADHKLYYDQDGSGSAFSGIAVATFTGVNSMAAGDFNILV